MSVRELMRELWTAVLDVLPVERIGGKPGDLNVSDAAVFRGNGVPFVLERVREGERMVLRRVRVRLGEEDPETGIFGIEDATSYRQDGRGQGLTLRLHLLRPAPVAP